MDVSSKAEGLFMFTELHNVKVEIAKVFEQLVAGSIDPAEANRIAESIGKQLRTICGQRTDWEQPPERLVAFFEGGLRRAMANDVEEQRRALFSRFIEGLTVKPLKR